MLATQNTFFGGRKKMNRSLIGLSRTLLLLGVVLGLVFVVSASAEGNAGGETQGGDAPNPAIYRIGVILPLTGDAASLGNFIRKGILLAQESLPSTVQDRVKLFFEDDQFLAAKTVTAYQKLVNVDKVDAVFVTGSGAGNAVGPIAERDKKLLVAIGASDKKFVIGKKFVFTHWVSPESETTPLVEKVKAKNFQHIGIIATEHEGANSLRDAFIQELKAQVLGDRVVFDEKVAVGAQEFKTLIAKAQSKGVDGLCTIILPGSLATFSKQARELGFTGEIFGYELFEDPNEVKASDGALVGKWYVNASDPSADFLRRYKAKYNETPGFGAGNAYDAMALVSFAAAAYSNSNEKMADHLRALKDYHGAVGLYSATGDNRFALPAVIKVVEKDGFKKID